MGKVSRHACDVCLRSFARQGDLNRHTRTHNADKPFKCKDCSKGFSQSSGLKTHMNTHTGNKPYLCSFGCASRFSDPSSCARHEKERHRRIIPYRCPDPYCSSRIKRRSSFAEHLKSKHGIDVDIVDIDSFAPPLLPPLAKKRKPRGKSLKIITDTTIMDEFKEQPFDYIGGPSSASAGTPSPVIMPRGSNLLDNLQVPLYSDITVGFFPLDSPVDWLNLDQCRQFPICAPPFPLSAGVTFEPLQTTSVGIVSLNPHHANTIATRDVDFDLNYLPIGFRGELSDYSFPGSVKSWS